MQVRLAKILVFLVVMVSYRGAAGTNYEIAKPGCQDECGHVKIPFPFGIGEGCFRDGRFIIKCDNSSISSSNGEPIPMIGDQQTNHTVLSISLEDHSLHITSKIAYQCYNAGQPITTSTDVYNLDDMADKAGIFNISDTRNLLVGIGCDTTARVSDSESAGLKDSVGCITSCDSADEARNGTCSGRGCCATSIFNTMKSPTIHASSMSNFTQVQLADGSSQCSVAFVTEAVNGSYAFSVSSLKASPPSNYGNMRVPVVFNWIVQYGGIGGLIGCSDAKKAGNDYLCGSNTQCVDENIEDGYRCKCIEGYAGNPYLSHGCQDINECSNSGLNDCEKKEYCVNTEGGYHCTCPIGFRGEATNTSHCFPTPDAHFSPSMALIGLSIGLGSIIGFIILLGLYKLFIRRKQIRERERNFKTNGGLLLQQDMSSNEGAINRTKIFSQSELEMATDNFNDNRVLGRGGQGTVYKGMLVDGTIVAVKKSKKVDETQLAQFINEVVILSQINHRNVVKLFGCCLETEVPLLVYEFVPNGTLYQHIHHPNEDFQLTWMERLQIAVECAGAVAYLHSSCSSPIYHRDIKSSNILLDDKYKAKISDFGTSRTISIDKTHVTTCVQGTFGYLDPEFFQSSQFTDKSDVYSFGVVLLELLTSKKPIFTDTSKEPRGLATEFVQLVETNANELGSILDPQVLQHCSEEEIEALAMLIKRCLSLSGKQRPTMKEVVRTLEMVKSHQGGEEGNSATEDGISKQDGVTWTDLMGIMNEGPCSPSTTSAFTDSSYSMDVHPLLFDSK